MKKPSSCPVSPKDRGASLNALRHEKMAESAHAYVRGSTVKFYDWLGKPGSVAIPEGPPVWICGDCHVGNLGPVAGADGSLEIAIRDLDQTVIGNPAHDLMRLGLSLAMAARGSDLPGVTTAHMLERMVDGYESALADDNPELPAEMPATVRLAMRRASGRSWKHLADERIEGVAPSIPLGKRFWPLEAHEQEALRELFADEAVRVLVTSLRSRDDSAPIAVVDAAYWRKGCSSLGRLRYAVLVAIGKGKAIRHCLIDVKEAIAPTVPRNAQARMPRDNAARVVEGARQLSPALGTRMVPLRLLDRAVFLRELMPQDLKLEIEHLTRDEAMQVALYLSAVVGRAHGRQLGRADRAAWAAELGRNRSKTLDAPSWLWASTVDLVGTHEAAYLEHCRRHALTAAA
jgi:uncharacterized protein (DUF2252 family)